MIKKVVRKGKLSTPSEVQDNLRYWLSRTPEERVAEVERLRRQRLGVLPRMQKVARLYQRTPDGLKLNQEI